MSKDEIINDARDVTLRSLLDQDKFLIDYYQREYRWEYEHLHALIEDLTEAFEANNGGENENNSYYLGSVVLCYKDDKFSIIDGQQRMTTLTLILIYLRHDIKDEGLRKNIETLIYSYQRPEHSINITDPEESARTQIIYDLLNNIEKNDIQTIIEKYKNSKSNNIKNIINRYQDISDLLDINEDKIDEFADWLMRDVILVKIICSDQADAYRIFEAMNDRGINLTNTELLKAYLLTQIADTDKRQDAEKIWKEEIQKLRNYKSEVKSAVDIENDFFVAYFRAQYAKSISDSDEIGSGFHNWFREKYEKRDKKPFLVKKPDDLYDFIKSEIPFFVEYYIMIRKAQEKYDERLPHLYYLGRLKVAPSLCIPLLLSPIQLKDKNQQDLIVHKMELVAQYLENYIVRLCIKKMPYSASSIKYEMEQAFQSFRNNTPKELERKIKNYLKKYKQDFNDVENFTMVPQNNKNKTFVKHLIARVSGYLDKLMDAEHRYEEYYSSAKGQKYEIEHIWGEHHYCYHKDEFEDESVFLDWRQKIGGLLIVNESNNSSYKDDKYEDKINYYLKNENSYAKALHPDFHQKKNPKFLIKPKIQKLNFESHPQFKKDDMVKRCQLVKRICEEVWKAQEAGKKLRLKIEK